MKIELLEFLILSLATFRLARLLTTDVIFEDFREWIWRKKPPHTKFGYLFTCNWCMSIWTASLIVICYTIVPIATLAVCSVLALSAVAGLITTRLDN